MSLTGFKPAFPASERKQIHTLGRAATRINLTYNCKLKFFREKCQLFYYVFGYTQSYLISLRKGITLGLLLLHMSCSVV